MIEFQRQPPLQNTLNVTPLIDVIFLLLLFFILTSVFADPGISVDLPESASAEFQQAEETVQITLLANGDIGLNNTVISIDALPAALTALFRQTTHHVVTVNADQNAPFSLFVRIIDVVKASGGEKLIISAEVPQ